MIAAISQTGEPPRQPDHIFVIGGVSFNTLIFVDRFPRPHPQTVFSRGFHETVGSTGAGKALNLAALGLRVTLHGLIGSDDEGERVRRRFRQTDISLHFDIDPAGTKRHVNLMDGSGDRISIFLNNGSQDPRVNSAAIEAAVAASDVVALNVLNYARRFVPFIKDHGKPIWTDLHDYDGGDPYFDDFINAADVVFLSTNALRDYRGFMQRLIDQGKRLVVATHGSHGATAVDDGGEWYEVPIVDGYPLVDSNGAGDAFFAGVLAARLRSYPLPTAFRLGALTAALCVTCLELAHPALSWEALADHYFAAFGETLPEPQQVGTSSPK